MPSSDQHPTIHATPADVEIIATAAGDGDKTAKFTITAYTGGELRVSQYDLPIVVDLSGLEAKAPLPVLRDHDIGRIVGHATEVANDGKRLSLSGIVSGGGEVADEVVRAAKAGFPWKASVGAQPTSREFVPQGKSISVNGRTFKGPLYVARKAILGEVSFVAVGADQNTNAAIAAQQSGVSKMPETNPHSNQGEKSDFEKIEARVAQFNKQFGEIDADFGRKIIRAAGNGTLDWATARAEIAEREVQLHELADIRAERPQAPAIHSSTRDMTQPVIEAAFCRSAGLAEPEKHFKPETLEAADRNFRGGFGVQELLVMAARQNGYQGRERITAGNIREVLGYALPPVHASRGFSGIDTSGILSSSANKILLDGFNQGPQTWREVARPRTVSDFKSVTAYRLTADLEYAELGPTGEITHGELGEESYSMQAKTYAKMLTLTRQDIINDDLGAFDDLRTRLGLGAAIKMSKVFWTLWINNSSFFTTARGNLSEGTDTVLGISGLSSAGTLLRKMRGPDGNLLGLEPDRLVVPPELELTGRQLYVSQEIRDTTADTEYAVANPYLNRFKPVVVPELSDDSYTGYSETAWYLLANPAVLATAVMCFLNGVQSPTIESADADFNTLGVQMRGYHDFGVAMTEYRAGVKSTGEAE